ncbi:hypothetical protein ACS0TY_003619 [Phlomoides rotata]
MTLITKTQKLFSSVGDSVTSKKFWCISGDDEYLGSSAKILINMMLIPLIQEKTFKVEWA